MTVSKKEGGVCPKGWHLWALGSPLI